MNKFLKVTYEQFRKDWIDWTVPDDIIQSFWSDITLPKRATAESAGYDFFAPFDFCIYPRTEMTIPTGVKVKLSPGTFLMIVPRSGLGFKYQLNLANTVGIIDCDYFANTKNEGHIMVKLVNRGLKECHIKKNEAFCQGIILPYGLTIDDNATQERVGGIGSTSE